MTVVHEAELASLRRAYAELQGRLNESIAQRAASAEVMRLISASPGDADLSLRRIAEITERLFGASSVSLLIADGERWGQTIRVGAGSERIAAAIPLAHVAITPQFMPGAVYLENRQVHVPDIDEPAAMARWPGLTPARVAGTRTMSGTPLRREGRAIGALIVHRDRMAPFTEDELALQQSFADQAAIATENARLFNEVQARTRDLTEALTYQTGSSNILRVIASSPTDVGPVLKAIVESACELCEADDALVVLKDDNELVFKAQHGSIPVVWERQPINRHWASGRAVIDRKPVHVHDLLSTEGEEFPDAQGFARRANVRTVLSVPLLRDNEGIGAIVLRRTEVQPFGDKQIALLQTFADQAVIAIGNVRLFNETQDALERQTATADILKVIASSPTNIQPVFDA
ncbi:MAG TPA: GAF domain-containing protein, partial [Bradyrhizobium sp.]|nr:GAF domain-containing protein [Bradyrhizobium sp.]